MLNKKVLLWSYEINSFHVKVYNLTTLLILILLQNLTYFISPNSPFPTIWLLQLQSICQGGLVSYYPYLQLMVLSSASNWHQLLVRTSPIQKMAEKDFRGKLQCSTLGPLLDILRFGKLAIAWKLGKKCLILGKVTK